MDTNLTALTAAVAAETSVNASAVTLLTGLKAQLDAAIAAQANGDDTALPALSASLSAATTNLQAAITANTPVSAAVAATPAS